MPSRSKSQHQPPKSIGHKFVLIYLGLMLAIGLPITVWSVGQTINSRSEAEIVTITATVPQSPYNTPNYGEVANQPPIITGPDQITLSLNQPIYTEYLITDPDWIPSQSSPKASLNPQFDLPETLVTQCNAYGNFAICRISGTSSTWFPSGQQILLTATDHYGASSSLTITTNYDQ